MEESKHRQLTLTVGNIEKAQVTLVDLDYNVLQLPKYILPRDVKPGSVIKMIIAHDKNQEEKRQKQMEKVQRDLQFRKTGPVNKILQE